MVEKVITEALGWVGYLEKKSSARLDDFKANAGNANYTIFAEWYKKQWGSNYQAQPWCAVWVSVVFLKALGADVQASIMKEFAYCPTGANWFEKNGTWATDKPQKGDVIFFKDSDGIACHTGIVYDVDSKNVYTVEGNTSSASGVIANGGAVEKKSYALTYNRIMGYGRPKYEEGEEDVKRYSTVTEMPDYAKQTIQKLIDLGILQGGAKGLDLSEDMIRIFVINDRAGLYK